MEEEEEEIKLPSFKELLQKQTAFAYVPRSDYHEPNIPTIESVKIQKERIPVEDKTDFIKNPSRDIPKRIWDLTNKMDKRILTYLINDSGGTTKNKKTSQFIHAVNDHYSKDLKNPTKTMISRPLLANIGQRHELLLSHKDIDAIWKRDECWLKMIHSAAYQYQGIFEAIVSRYTQSFIKKMNLENDIKISSEEISKPQFTDKIKVQGKHIIYKPTSTTDEYSPSIRKIVYSPDRPRFVGGKGGLDILGLVDRTVRAGEGSSVKRGKVVGPQLILDQTDNRQKSITQFAREAGIGKNPEAFVIVEPKGNESEQTIREFRQNFEKTLFNALMYKFTKKYSKYAYVLYRSLNALYSNEDGPAECKKKDKKQNVEKDVERPMTEYEIRHTDPPPSDIGGIKDIAVTGQTEMTATISIEGSRPIPIKIKAGQCLELIKDKTFKTQTIDPKQVLTQDDIRELGLMTFTNDQFDGSDDTDSDYNEYIKTNEEKITISNDNRDNYMRMLEIITKTYEEKSIVESIKKINQYMKRIGSKTQTAAEFANALTFRMSKTYTGKDGLLGRFRLDHLYAWYINELNPEREGQVIDAVDKKDDEEFLRALITKILRGDNVESEMVRTKFVSPNVDKKPKKGSKKERKALPSAKEKIRKKKKKKPIDIEDMILSELQEQTEE